MKIKWEINDGYVGNRPHYTEIDEDDLDYDTEEEKENEIDEIIREEFRSRIDYCWEIIE